jgi:hypothetical protein
LQGRTHALTIALAIKDKDKEDKKLLAELLTWLEQVRFFVFVFSAALVV